MTRADLRDWQARHGFTYESAAAALGISRSTYGLHLKTPGELPRLLWLACLAIDAGLDKKPDERRKP